MILPERASNAAEIAPGAIALPRGLLFLERSRAVVAADAHFAYEDVIGGALPLWSTRESLAAVLAAVVQTKAREVIFLGDVIHGSRMSAGAAALVRDALQSLRERCTVTIVAGNHEGRTRGRSILGETHEGVERDGWQLVHGDEPVAAPRSVIGHLHPSIALGGRTSIPAFLASPRIVVVPALTPYSRGLDVLSRECGAALKRFVSKTSDVTVTASGPDKVYPFGSLTRLRRAL